MSNKSKDIRYLLILLAGIIAINTLSLYIFKRIDLTANGRYTLSEASREIIKKAEKPIFVSVFLKGDLPSNFKGLQRETQYLLEEFRALNPHIKYRFYNPLEESDADAEEIGRGFFENDMPPQRLRIKKDGKESQRLIFPWAVASYEGKNVKIPLLKMNPEDGEEELVNNSVQNLEYAFADGFKKLTTPKSKKIAVMRGNGELEDRYLASFLKTVGNYYHVAPFTLDAVTGDPQKTLDQLIEYDLIVEAKPTQSFTEKEKLVLDQYLMNGGRALWLVETVAAEKDSLFANNGQLLAYPIDLNLSDFFFKYGIRILPSLVNDLHADNLILASGQGRDTQFTPYPWYYAPLVVARSKNPIVNNITPVRFDFANPIDTLKNKVHKTILLQSSIAAKTEGTPLEIRLAEILNQKPDFTTYTNSQQPLAVLLEGVFTSVYKDRIKPFEPRLYKAESVPTRMIVVADGDVIKNEIENGQPASLAYHPKTGKSYGNEEFLLNAVNYLLDDSSLLNIRTKTIKIGFLNPEKISAQKAFWQFFNIGLPLVLLLGFGLLYRTYRKRKYKKPL